MTAPERAPLGAALALLLAVISLTGPAAPALMAAEVMLISFIIGVSWSDLLELPSRQGTRLVVGGSGFLGALAALVAPARVDPVTAILIVCALGVFASFVHQMLRPRRYDLTTSLTGTVAGVFVTTVAASWVLAQDSAADAQHTSLITAIGMGLAATLLLNTIPQRIRVRLPIAIVVGTVVTTLLAVVLTGLTPLAAIAVGVVVSVSGACTHLLLGSSLTAREPAAALAVAAGPVATVGVVAYIAVTMLF
ncbi:hypothetical protein ACXET9_10290 [Brachybacterium sp. DNPG3]